MGPHFTIRSSCNDLDRLVYAKPFHTFHRYCDGCDTLYQFPILFGRFPSVNSHSFLAVLWRLMDLSMLLVLYGLPSKYERELYVSYVFCF